MRVAGVGAPVNGWFGGYVGRGVVGSVCVGFVLALPLPLLLLLPLLSLLNVTMVMPSCLGVGARVTPSTPPFASHPAIYSFLFLLFFLYFALQPG